MIPILTFPMSMQNEAVAKAFFAKLVRSLEDVSSTSYNTQNETAKHVCALWEIQVVFMMLFDL